MSTAALFRDHYSLLLRGLPMTDPTFVGALFTNGLLPGNVKETIDLLSTSSEKAAQFLDKIIQPSIDINNNSSFNKLLKVMNESDYDRMKQLAETINLVCVYLCVYMCVGVCLIVLHR